MPDLAPGGYITEIDTPSFTQFSNSSMSAVFVGAHQQGPLVPTVLQSWGDFVSNFGGFGNQNTGPSDLALGVYGFFNNGGGFCYVLRVAHSDAVTATGSILTGDATPIPTLGVTAANPGAWANQIQYQTQTNPDGTFNLYLYRGGTAPGNIVERWTTLSMSQTSSRYAVAVINDPFAGSNFIRLTDLLGTASLPGRLPGNNPPEFLGSAASGGVTGADGSSVVASDYLATTTVLDTIVGPIVINLPGVSDASGTLNPLINYCSQMRSGVLDAMLVPDVPQGINTVATLAYVATLTPSTYAAGPYYPWLVINDPSSNAPGARRTVAPGAFAMGQWAATDATRGVQKAPAGVSNTLSVLTLERQMPLADIGTLTAAHVNCIRTLPGAGIVIWGARTLSTNTDVEYIPTRRLLIEIEASLLEMTQFAVFEPNDNVTWAQITLRIDAYLSQLYAQGAFAGPTPAQSYVVICGPQNNTYQSNTINVSVGVAIASPAEFIFITVSQGLLGSSASISNAAGTPVG